MNIEYAFTRMCVPFEVLLFEMYVNLLFIKHKPGNTTRVPHEECGHRLALPVLIRPFR